MKQKKYTDQQRALFFVMSEKPAALYALKHWLKDKGAVNYDDGTMDAKGNSLIRLYNYMDEPCGIICCLSDSAYKVALDYIEKYTGETNDIQF